MKKLPKDVAMRITESDKTTVSFPTGKPIMGTKTFTTSGTTAAVSIMPSTTINGASANYLISNEIQNSTVI